MGKYPRILLVGTFGSRPALVFLGFLEVLAVLAPFWGSGPSSRRPSILRSFSLGDRKFLVKLRSSESMRRLLGTYHRVFYLALGARVAGRRAGVEPCCVYEMLCSWYIYYFFFFFLGKGND